jgi:uncharacterized protein
MTGSVATPIRSNWSSLAAAAEPGPVVLTYNMNILPRLVAPQPFCVTLDDDMRVNPSHGLRRLTYEYPLFAAGWTNA